MTKDFFRGLTPFTDFLEFASANVYTPVPADGHLIVSDVEGSTQAIEAGRYKVVNMVGASTIAAVMNVYESLDLPFVFGGDGATVLVASEELPRIKEALRAVQRNATEAFGLNLRVGIVPVADVYAAHLELSVAKHALGSSGRCLAFFRGEGVDAVERWVKGGKYLLEPGAEADLGSTLRGLSCRWAPIQSTRGHTLSILIKGRLKNDDAALRSVARRIDEIVDLSSPDARPANAESLEPESLADAAELEIAMRRLRPKPLFKASVAVQMVAVRVMRRWNLKSDGIGFQDYMRDIPQHSDFRKYDETLRMVIDCTDVMRERIEQLLQSEYLAGRVFYGVHASKTALMTCFVQSLQKGGHLHFIDGGDGGYAAAARELKRQIKAERGTSIA
ncbi:MAG: DUF3095 family protein [Deltaproteobacteria bacterium]|nr:DUF3095 family protein [Deltaproteobacteria bacterium]